MDTSEHPIVRTSAGLVRGVTRESSLAFFGVPYAAAPIGEHRLTAPAPHPGWEGVRDATEFGPTPLRGQTDETIIPEHSVPGDETLNVNVFTPDLSGQAPVMVYVHGGGYAAGSIATTWYDGESLARRGVVTIVASYRLGFDGFGWVQDAPLNRGLLDLIQALEWVQENIRAFGGDPGRVTLVGQSAGAGVVLALFGSPKTQHLFHGAWAMSPTVGGITRDDAQRFGEGVARGAGIPPTLRAWRDKSEEEMRLAAQDAIAARDLRRARATLAAGPRLGPTVDDDLLPASTLSLLAQGHAREKPLVIGATDDEFSRLTEPYRTWLRFIPTTVAMMIMGVPPRRARRYLRQNRSYVSVRDSTAVVGHVITDAVFRRQIIRVTRARAGGGSRARTWVYHWTWPSPVLNSAIHCIDVPFLFGTLDAERAAGVVGHHPPASLQAAYQEAAVDLIARGACDWTPWRSSDGTARVFDAPEPSLRERRGAYEGTRALT